MTYFQLLNPDIYIGVMEHFIGITLIFGIPEYEGIGCGYVYVYSEDCSDGQIVANGVVYDYPN